MLVLDTDHISELDRASRAGAALMQRLEASGEEISTTVISAEEQLRGWLAQIRSQQDAHRWIPLYQRLYGRIEFYAHGLVLPWNQVAAEIYLQLRAQRIRIGTLDRRIASIFLALGATLLSRNLRDYQKVPALRFENWLD